LNECGPVDPLEPMTPISLLFPHSNLPVDLAIAPHSAMVATLRHDTETPTHAVARNLIGWMVKLAPGMKSGHDQFRADLVSVGCISRKTPPITHNRNRIILMNDNTDRDSRQELNLWSYRHL
jgi:hypothetical protein